MSTKNVIIGDMPFRLGLQTEKTFELAPLSEPRTYRLYLEHQIQSTLDSEVRIMQSSLFHRMFWGIVIVAIGAVFLLNQIGAVDIDIGYLFSHYWPVFVIFFGFQGLLFQRQGGFLWNSVVILFGVFFLGRNLQWFDWEFGDIARLIGPVVLILFGIGMIFRGNRPRKKGIDWMNGQPGQGWNAVTPPSNPFDLTPPGPPPAPPLSEDPGASFTDADEDGKAFEAASSAKPGKSAGTNPCTPPTRPVPPTPPFLSAREQRRQYREERRQHHRCYRHQHHHHHHHHQWWDPNAETHSRFIGDVYLGNDYWELRPMSISHFIGDSTIDLTKAQVPLGETRVYISSFIGDVKVFVPNDPSMGIQVISSCLIGDVSVLDQKRGGLFNQMSVQSPSFSDAEKRVVLVVSSFIGDVRVTKVG